MNCLFLWLFLGCICWQEVSATVSSASESFIKLDFASSFKAGEVECETELSSSVFAQAIITVDSDSTLLDESFFVAIFSNHATFSSESSCSQFGGGDYQYQNCQKTQHFVTTTSASGDKVVTIPFFGEHDHFHPFNEEETMWTICVGRGSSSQLYSDALLHTSGSVVLSTSSKENLEAFQGISGVLSSPEEIMNGIRSVEKQRDIDVKLAKQFVTQEALVHAATAPSACSNTSSYANGYCDSDNNVADCNYDGGDCCFEDCTDSNCLIELASYPKFCYKDETINVNFLQEHSLNSSEYCAPNFDANTRGSRCSLRTAVDFCRNYVVGENRCIIEIPAGLVEINSSQIALADNNRSIVIRGQSSATTFVKNTGVYDSRFLFIDFASDHSSTTAVVVEKLSIMDFTMSGNWGGAIYCKRLKSGTFSDLFFFNNSAGFGGGIYANGVDNTVFSGLVFANNSATVDGGGMYLSDAAFPDFDNCAFTSNTAGVSAGGIYLTDAAFPNFNTITFLKNEAAVNGGAVFCSNTVNLIVTKSGFYSNEAYFGGGLYAAGVVGLSVDYSNFASNYATVGGGVFFFAGVFNAAISLSDAVNNMAVSGGTVYISSSENVTLQSSSFTYNTATFQGGAVYVTATVRFSTFNSTFASNFGPYGGAVFLNEGVHYASLSNTLFTTNRGVVGGAVRIGDLNSHHEYSYCTFRGNVGYTGGAVAQWNGNHFMLFTYCNFVSNFATFGAAFMDNADGHDMMFSFNTFTSNTGIVAGGALLATTTAERWTFHSNTFTSNVAANGGVVVMFSACLNATFTNNTFTSNAAFDKGGGLSFASLNTNIHIEGNTFIGNTALQGGGLYFFQQNDNLVIMNNTFVGNFAAQFGGAIAFSQGHKGCIIRDSVFTSNNAITTGGGVYFGFSSVAVVSNCVFRLNTARDYGGGAFAMASFNNIELQRCQFHHNTAYFGGALFASLKAERLHMVDMTFTDNSAISGGGLYIGFFSDDVNIKSVIVNQNQASCDGGGIYIDIDSNVTLDNLVISDNMAGSRGGGIHCDSDDLKVLSSSFVSNTAGIKGGGLDATGDYLVVSSSSFENNEATDGDGGGLHCEGSSDVQITNVNFTRNAAERNGGACVFSSVTELEVEDTFFVRNKANVSGGAVSIEASDGVTVWTSSFSYSEALAAGGALYINNCVNVSYSHCNFDSNALLGSGGGGSAIWASASDINISSSDFKNNRNPSSGGTVYWEVVSGMEEPGGLHDPTTTFSQNVALYGANMATEIVGFDVSTVATLNTSGSYSYFISQYGKAITVDVAAQDYYQQRVLSDNSTLVQVLTGDVYDCGDKLPSLSGSTIEKLCSGAVRFEAMFSSCVPGGYMTVQVRDMEGSSALVSPVMTWSYRSCIRGEYFRDGECTACEQGFYSKQDNSDLSVTECIKCPEDAVDCYSDTIVLDKGYWALSRDSEDMTECPMGKKSCIGGVQTVEIISESDFDSYETTNSSICNDGYTGVLCAICRSDYFYSPSSNTCEPCSDSGVNVYLIVLLCLISLCLIIPICVLVLTWSGSTTLDSVITNFSLPAIMYMFYLKCFVLKKTIENETDEQRRKREDEMNIKFLRIMPKFKIFVAMFQITSSMPAILAMSFSPFFTEVASIFGVLNFDIVANLGLSCQFRDVDYVDYLVMTCLLPLALCVVLVTMYIVHRFFLMRRRATYEEAARVYSKYLLVFLMGTYFLLPGISVYIFQTFSCQDIDPDDVTSDEDLYLRADVSIKCGSSRHQAGTTFATFMICVYPIGVPLLYYYLLYQVKEGIINRGGSISKELRLAIMPTSFLYSSYEPQFWYWEIIETIRRIMMTGVLVLVAQGTSLQIVVTILLTLVFIKMYAHFKPFDDDILDTDAEFAQYQVFFVVFIALLIKEESIPSMEQAWGPLLVFVIFSLLLLSPLRYFKDKFLPENIKRLVDIDHENYDLQLEGLKNQERKARRGSLLWAKSIGVDNPNYHSDDDNDDSELFSRSSSLDDEKKDTAGGTDTTIEDYVSPSNYSSTRHECMVELSLSEKAQLSRPTSASSSVKVHPTIENVESM